MRIVESIFTRQLEPIPPPDFPTNCDVGLGIPKRADDTTSGPANLIYFPVGVRLLMSFIAVQGGVRKSALTILVFPDPWEITHLARIGIIKATDKIRNLDRTPI